MKRRLNFSPNSDLKCCSSIFPGVRTAPGRWLPVALPVMVPGALCGMSHDFLVTHDIFLQETSCSVCLETRATALQVTLGAFLPFVSSVAGTMLLGHQMNLKWLPQNRSGSPILEVKVQRVKLIFSALLSFCKKTASKSAPMLAGWTVFQMLMAGAVVSGEIHSYRSVLEELNIRVRDREGIDSRLGHGTLERE